MKRLTALLFVLALAACAAPPVAPSASATVAAASPTPTPVATTAAPTTAAPTATPTLIPLPSTAQIDAPTGTVVWSLVADTRLFRSTDRGDTWQERPVPPQLPVIVSFIDDHEGWALVPQGVGVPPPNFARQSGGLTEGESAAASPSTFL